MVRLLPGVQRAGTQKWQSFQSHNGAIAASLIRCGNGLMPCFNPTMVRLLPQKWRGRLESNLSFNPTMVRLLPKKLLRQLAPEIRFQSHNGAIAASCCLCLRICVLDVSIPQWCDCCVMALLKITIRSKFQSHNGAIAAQELIERFRQLPEVSIPQWCDCCGLRYIAFMI